VRSPRDLDHAAARRTSVEKARRGRGANRSAGPRVANDEISDLGAVTASSSWIYNPIGANLTGLLVVALALGLCGRSQF
jgi:hypothetical protein